jgi:hypothetical protein
MAQDDRRLESELAGGRGIAPASSDDVPTIPLPAVVSVSSDDVPTMPLPAIGSHRHRLRRRLTAACAAAVLVMVLGGAGYAFVLKSFPYQTPQDPPPRIALTPSVIAHFASYSSGLANVPVLSWRDVSKRSGLLVTAPRAFATQLAVLRQEGFRSISLSELKTIAAGRATKPPGRPLVLTFDDGLSTDWTTVDPIIKRYGFRAIVFINPANVAIKSPSYFLTREELLAMASSGRWDIGLELPGGWRSEPEASSAAARGRKLLQLETGRHVATYGWSTLQSPTAPGRHEPAATYLALRKQFDVVFDRPTSGQASFVVSGSAAGPLPRVKVRATDTLRSLSLRLRTGVQAPPPRNIFSLPWHPAGADCKVTTQSLQVTSEHFGLCTAQANGTRWTDYGLQVSISGRVGVTAIVELRDNPSGCLEIAVGRSELAIKQRVGHHWSVLRTINMYPRLDGGGAGTGNVPAGSRSTALLGNGTLKVSVTLTGRILTLQVMGKKIMQQVSPELRNGAIALGMIASGKSTTMSFGHTVLVKSSLR